MLAVNVVVAVDAANLEAARVLLHSIREHVPWYQRLRFHVIYSGIVSAQFDRVRKERLPNTRVIGIPVDNPFEHWGSIGYISAATLLRLLIPKLLPRLHRVIYLDADTLVLANLAELRKVDLGHKMAGGVLDFPLMFEVDNGLHGTSEYLRDIVGVPVDSPYVNAGVLVLDLHRLRAARFVERASTLLEQRGTEFKFRDQDVLNALLRDQMAVLDPRWNSMITMSHQPLFKTQALQDAVAVQQRDPLIVHFAGPRKPWHPGYDGPHAELWRRQRERLAD